MHRRGKILFHDITFHAIDALEMDGVSSSTSDFGTRLKRPKLAPIQIAEELPQQSAPEPWSESLHSHDDQVPSPRQENSTWAFSMQDTDHRGCVRSQVGALQRFVPLMHSIRWYAGGVCSCGCSCDWWSLVYSRERIWRNSIDWFLRRYSWMRWSIPWGWRWWFQRLPRSYTMVHRWRWYGLLVGIYGRMMLRSWLLRDSGSYQQRSFVWNRFWLWWWGG